MTLQETMAEKLNNLEAAYTTEKAKIEAEIALLAPSGWLTRDVQELKTWLSAAAHHIGL